MSISPGLSWPPICGRGHRPRCEGRGGGGRPRTRQSSPTSLPPRRPGCSRGLRRKFAGIDVLVNNAEFLRRFFESSALNRSAIDRDAVRPENVTRAVLPVCASSVPACCSQFLDRASPAKCSVPRMPPKFGLRGGWNLSRRRSRLRNPHNLGRARVFPRRAAYQQLNVRQAPVSTTMPRRRNVAA